MAQQSQHELTPEERDPFERSELRHEDEQSEPEAFGTMCGATGRGAVKR